VGGERAGDMVRRQIQVGYTDTLHRKGKDSKPRTGQDGSEKSAQLTENDKATGCLVIFADLPGQGWLVWVGIVVAIAAIGYSAGSRFTDSREGSGTVLQTVTDSRELLKVHYLLLYRV
jgi:hypothetical protein